MDDLSSFGSGGASGGGSGGGLAAAGSSDGGFSGGASGGRISGAAMKVSGEFIPAGPQLELGDKKIPDVVPFMTAKESVFTLVFILINSLQELSLIQIDGLEFSLWGDYFAFLDVFSLNFEYNLNLPEFELAILTTALLAPVFLILIVSRRFSEVRVSVTSDQITAKLIDKRFKVISTSSLIATIIGLLCVFIADDLTIKSFGAILITFGGYGFIFIVYFCFVYGFLNFKDPNHLNYEKTYEKFKEFELVTVFLSLNFLLATMTRTILEEGVLSGSLLISISFGLLGTLVVIYTIGLFIMLSIALKSHLKPTDLTFIVLEKIYFLDKNKVFDENKRKYYPSFDSNDSNELDRVSEVSISYNFLFKGKLLTYLKQERLFFYAIFSLEKIFLVIPQIVISILFEENDLEFGDYKMVKHLLGDVHDLVLVFLYF